MLSCAILSFGFIFSSSFANASSLFSSSFSDSSSDSFSGSSDSSSDDSSDQHDVTFTDVKFGTYNTFQLFLSPLQSQREQLTISELLSTYNDIDILCLQELYFYTDKERFINQLNSLYPYSASESDFWQTPAGGNGSKTVFPRIPCSSNDESNIDILNAMTSDCVLQFCGPVYEATNGNTQIFLGCMVQACPGEFEVARLSECFNCIGFSGSSLSSFGLAVTYDNAISICTNIAFNFQFELQDDTLILSKYPIINRYYFELPTAFLNVGLNIAQIGINKNPFSSSNINTDNYDHDDSNSNSNSDSSSRSSSGSSSSETEYENENENENESETDIDSIYVICSHFQATSGSSTTLSDINPSYPWQEEIEFNFTDIVQLNRRQIEVSLELLENTINVNSDENYPIFWLGDLNVGVLVEPQSFDLIREDGFIDMPELEFDPDCQGYELQCTWCVNENVLIQLSAATDRDEDIDHILVKNDADSSSSSSRYRIIGLSGDRIFENEFELEGIGEVLGDNNNISMAPLSDHYGLELKVRIKKTD